MTTKDYLKKPLYVVRPSFPAILTGDNPERVAIFDWVLSGTELSALQDNYEKETSTWKTYKITANTDKEYRIVIGVDGCDLDQTIEFTCHTDQAMIHLNCGMPITITSPDAHLDSILICRPKGLQNKLCDVLGDLDKQMAQINDNYEDQFSEFCNYIQSLEKDREDKTSLKVINYKKKEEEIGWGTTLLAAAGTIALGAVLKQSQKVQHKKQEDKTEVNSG